MNHVEAAAWLLSHDGYLILTHVRPDGDTVGCAAALCIALRERGKQAHVLPNPQITPLFAPYLEGLLAPDGYQPRQVVSVDIAARSLFPDNAQCYLDRVDLAIDHHPSQEFFARETCLDASCAACGELVYDILREFGPVSPAAALPLYVAVSTDCGCFVYGNTSARTHRVAADLMELDIPYRQANLRHFRTKSIRRLQLESHLTQTMEFFDGGEIGIVTISLELLDRLHTTEADIEDIAAFAGQVEGVKTAVTIRELKPDLCKISLRTDPALLNANAVCAQLGGGGHAAAAGASVSGTLQQTKQTLIQAIRAVQGAPAEPSR